MYLTGYTCLSQLLSQSCPTPLSSNTYSALGGSLIKQNESERIKKGGTYVVPALTPCSTGAQVV